MEKVAIVILNYLNYKDTIECVESIEQMKYDIAGIVIVDNGSNNDSWEILKRKYKGSRNIHVVRARKNYGFAKGNNIGIEIARKKFGTDYVFVVNNDVVFKDDNYFVELMKAYDQNVAIIGSEIHLKNGNIQREYSIFNIIHYFNPMAIWV